MSIFVSLLEPIACTMDNWGEGVVPAYREAISLQQTLVNELSFRKL